MDLDVAVVVVVGVAEVDLVVGVKTLDHQSQ